MEWLNYVILGLYLAMMVAIAIYTRNKAKCVKDFLFAGKKGLNGWLSAFAYGTTYFSAVIFIGYAGKFGWTFGLAALWIGIGNAIIGALLPWGLLAKKTRNITQRLDAKTMPDFFGKRYESKALKITTAVIVFIFLLPYAASVYNGLGNLFSIVFGIEGWVIMLILAGVTALYIFFGGYIATSLTDFIQGIIMLIGVVIMVIFFLSAPQVSWGEGFKTLINNDLGIINSAASDTYWLFDRPTALISLVLLTSFGVWALPQTIHKYYAIRDKKAIKQGQIVSTLFALIIGVGAYLVGSLSTLFYNDLSQVGGSTDNLMPYMLNNVIPNGVIGLIAVLVLAASMSTLASVSLSGASVVAIDIYQGCVDNKASDKKVTLSLRILSLSFVAISTLIAYLNTKFNITAIAYLMSLSWGVLAGCFIGPFVLGISWKKTTKAAAWTSVIGTLIITVSMIIGLGYLRGGNGTDFASALKYGMSSSPFIGVVCMAFSMLSTFVVSLFTRPASKKTITESFEKVIEGEIK